MYENITDDLIRFLKNSPTCYHAAANLRAALLAGGYTELSEGSRWNLAPGGHYFTVRNESSLIAFRLPLPAVTGFMIGASHSDSPTFKVKTNPEMAVENTYIRLNVEKYGGMLMAPWLDRPLSVAGRLIVKDGDCFVTRLVNVDRDLLLIPNLAIHMDRDVNDGHKFNPQSDLLPLFGDQNAKGRFLEIIAAAAGVDRKDIAGDDLFLYSRTPAAVWGASGEFFSSARIDDLQCAYAGFRGFFDAGTDAEQAAANAGEPESAADAAKPVSGSVPVYALFDNEEVGSGTKQGAASTFLRDVIERIAERTGMAGEDLRIALAGSFMVSADNGHALHPNCPEKADPVNRPRMNGGVLIKYNANQKYTTDSVSAALMKDICARAGVPWQEFTNRSDLAGGSTLGNISNTQVSLNTVDIGLAQLAMHSPYETAGTKDTAYLAKAMRVFYGLALTEEGPGKYRLK